MLESTHNLDLTISMDLSEILSSQNLKGATLALGATENNILEVFSNDILKKVKDIIDRYNFLEISNARLSVVTNEGVVDSSNSNSNNLVKLSDLNNSLISDIQDNLFNIKASMGELESIVVNSEELNKQLVNILNLSHDLVIFRPDLENNYVIRYIDVENGIQEIGG